MFFKKIIFWLPAIVWMLIIFYFSAQPVLHASDNQTQDFVIKKSAHFTEYGILAILIFFASLKTIALSKKNLILLSLGLTFLYASSDELHQRFVPGRQSAFRDVLIDTTGGLTALALVFYMHNTKPKEK